MTVGTLFTLFVVPVFYSLIAAQHQLALTREDIAVIDEDLLLTGAKG
jgi:multidrug efflux pump